MGMSISGGMLLGLPSDEVSSAVWDEDKELYGKGEDACEGFCDWYEEQEMDNFSEHYDAPEDCCFVGFRVKAVEPLSEEFESWREDLISKAKLFKELTGQEPTLAGMQNVR